MSVAVEQPISPSASPSATLSSVLRIVAYNIEDDISGNTTPLPGLYQVLEGIGEEKVAGNIRPIDILGLEETTSNADVAPIVTALNSYYGSADVYTQSSYQGTQSGSNADGNGPNALVYNSTTVTLLASVGVGTPTGSTNGVYRQPIRYEFQPVGDTGTNGIFYVYVIHTKSGTTSTDAVDRGEEATIIRNDEATLPATASVIYEGDLNTNPPEAMFTNFEATGQGEAYDPYNFPSSPTAVQQTDSSTNLSYRDDYQLQTSNVNTDTGAINYVTGSLHAFGNNGSVDNSSSASNTALNSDLFTDGGTFIPASTIYTDLGTASDHLPVVADYTFTTAPGTPAIGSFAAVPSSVMTGTPTTLTATNVAESGGVGSITGVNFYRETNSTTGLQIGSDTLVGAGSQSGTTWTTSAATTGLSSGNYTYYAVASDSNGTSSAVASTTLTVTTAVPGTPTIGSFTASPTSVATGTPTTLTAGSVVESNGTGAITGVNVYRESNSTTGLQIGSDTLVGAASQSGTSWSISAPTTGLSPGTYTYYAVAADSNGNSSAVASTTVTVTVVSSGTPTVGALTLSPSAVSAGTTISLAASNVFETNGTISSVSFYRESNGTSGLQTGTGGDTLVGNGTRNGSTWTLANTSTTGLATGAYSYYAIATDTSSQVSAAASATLTINAVASSGVIIGFDMSTIATGTAGNANNYGPSPFAPDTVASGVTDGGLTRGSGLTTVNSGGADAWGGNGFSTTATTEAAAITANDYATFTITANTNDTVSLSGIPAYNIRHSGTGPLTGMFQYQIGSGSFTDIGSAITWGSSTSSSGNTEAAITLSGITALQNVLAGTTITMRIVSWGATGASGTWYINDPTGTTANDFVVNGTVNSTASTVPTVDFSAATYTANESDGTATITVNRTGATTGISTIQYLTSDGTAAAGTDYTATTGTLTFNAGDTSKTFTVPLNNIAATAGTRALSIALYNPSSGSQDGTQSVATLTITDNIAPQFAFSSATYSANEADGTATITVNRTGGSQAASVNYATSNGSGLDGTDYTPASGTLNFTASQTSATFTITLTNVAKSTAGVVTVNLTLSAPSTNAQLGPQSTATLDITDNAVATLPVWLDPTSSATWNSTTHILTVTGDATIIANPGTDAPIIIGNGSASGDISTPALTIAPTTSDTVFSLGGLNLSNGATLAFSTTTSGLLATIAAGGSFLIDSTSSFDLGQNLLSIKGTASTSAATLNTVSSDLIFGQVTIGAGTADPTNLHTIGYALGSNLATSVQTINSVSIGSNDVLLRYTYYGDANLDGKVDGSDYSKIDSGFINQLSGWSNGDFNYDSAINGSDYTLIDNAFNTQGTPVAATELATTIAKPASVFSMGTPLSTAYPGGWAEDILLRHKKTVAQTIFE